MKKTIFYLITLFSVQTLKAQSVDIRRNSMEIKSSGSSAIFLYRINSSNTNNPIGINFGRFEDGNFSENGNISVKQLEFSHFIRGFGKFVFNNGFGEEMSINVNNVIHNNFTKLGSDAPAIKLKKLTSGCTTSANSGFPSGEISLTHGLTPSKILKVEALVEYATNFWVKDGNDLFGYEFDIYVTNTTISLRNLSGSASSEIRSKPCKILITYEE